MQPKKKTPNKHRHVTPSELCSLNRGNGSNNADKTSWIGACSLLLLSLCRSLGFPASWSSAERMWVPPGPPTMDCLPSEQHIAWRMKEGDEGSLYTGPCPSHSPTLSYGLTENLTCNSIHIDTHRKPCFRAQWLISPDKEFRATGVRNRVKNRRPLLYKLVVDCAVAFALVSNILDCS